MPRTIESPLTPAEACSRIMSLAEPEAPIEVSLIDGLGLVLAEDAIADVDLPPFDRSTTEGYAVRAAEARPGALLRIAGLRWSSHSSEETLETGEAIRVFAGDPLPVGADAILPIDEVRPDPETGPTRVIEILQGVETGRDVVRRGHLLEAGDVLATAGTQLRTSMVPLLASQGCVHPVCRRRVRVAVVAVGDHLVGPTEAPVMHRERNVVNAAIVSLVLQAGAMPHDLQAVPESDFPRALERATSAPVIIVLGPSSRSTSRAFKAQGAETVISGLALHPGGRSRYSVIRDEVGRVAHHIFHLPMAPLAASTVFAMLVHPLIARLQGSPSAGPRTVPAVWDGTRRSVGDKLRAIPVTLEIDADARHRARPIPLRGLDDLAGLAMAEGLALLPANSGPWLGGEIVEVYRFS